MFCAKKNSNLLPQQGRAFCLSTHTVHYSQLLSNHLLFYVCRSFSLTCFHLHTFLFCFHSELLLSKSFSLTLRMFSKLPSFFKSNSDFSKFGICRVRILGTSLYTHQLLSLVGFGRGSMLKKPCKNTDLEILHPMFYSLQLQP